MAQITPTILVVPGSFGLPYFYDSIVDPLTAQGYSIRAIPLLSAGRRPPLGPATMAEDAASIATEVEKLADEGKDVILFSHSYGGLPATEASKGLSKKERESQGKKGGIVRLAYLTALVPGVGGSCTSVMEGKGEVGYITVEEDGYMSQDAVESAKFNFSDLPPEEGQAWVKKFANHSAVSFSGELTWPGYKYSPVSYLLCEEDRTIPPYLQREMVENIEKEKGEAVDVHTIKTGHIPIASAPEKVIEFLVEIAKK